MNDYMAPSRQTGALLNSIVQNAVQSAGDERAMQARRQQQMQEIAKNFEVKANLSQALMATDPQASLDMMNDGLKGFGVALTMDQFHPAMKGFEVMADMTKTGDHRGAQGVLKSMKERGWLVNLQDQKRAAELEQQNREGLAAQQASVVTQAQPQDPQLARAQQHVSMVDMVGGDLSRVSPDELVRLTGTTDPTAQEHRLQLDRAILDGHVSKQKTIQQLFSLDPSAFGKAADITATHLANPESMAKWRVSELLSKPDRTEDEERELQGKASVYTPHLADALNLKSAARDKERLTNQLEDTRTRLSAITDHLGVDGQAREVVSSLDGAVQGLPDPSKPVSDGDAKQHLLAEGTRTIQGETFALKAKPRIESLEQTALEAEKQRERLAGMAVSALPGQKDTIERQMHEYASMAKANRAMARLLKDENPYAIAAKESDLALNPSESGAVELESLKAARAKDLSVIETEQARLKRRETILHSQQPAAERKEEQERQMRLAHQAVDVALSKGQPLTPAIREAGERFGVDKAELAKNVQTARGAGLWEAQNTFAMLPTSLQTTQQAGKIAQRFGVSAKDVMEGVKNPNKPLVEINTAETASKEAAKDFTKSTRATYDQLKTAPILLRNIDEAKALIPQAKGFMGPGGESLMEAAKFLNSRLGAKINTEGIKGAEELRTRIFFNIMENLKKMDAQPSEMQQMMMRDALGKLGTDPNALSNVLDAYGDTIRDKVELFNMEVSGAMKKGTDFPYDPRIMLPERRAATGEPLIKTDADYNALPPGTVFVGPDGKKRKKP